MSVGVLQGTLSCAIPCVCFNSPESKYYSILVGRHLASVIVMCARVPLTHGLTSCQGLRRGCWNSSFPLKGKKRRQLGATGVGYRLKLFSCEMLGPLLLPTTHCEVKRVTRYRTWSLENAKFLCQCLWGVRVCIGLPSFLERPTATEQVKTQSNNTGKLWVPLATLHLKIHTEWSQLTLFFKLNTSNKTNTTSKRKCSNMPF